MQEGPTPMPGLPAIPEPPATPVPPTRTEAGAAMAELVEAPDIKGLATLAAALGGSARDAGRKAVLGGTWAAEQLVDLAAQLPIRDRATLEAQTGLSGPWLAAELVRRATRTTATIGGAAGALAGASELLPATWVALPVELVVETLAVAAVEVKLVAELHEAYGLPLPGQGTERMNALLRSWADKRGVNVLGLLTAKGGLPTLAREGMRDELLKVVRKALLKRLGRSLSSFAPVFTGAVAGAAMNRRATRKLGDAIARDLAAAPGALAWWPKELPAARS